MKRSFLIKGFPFSYEFVTVNNTTHKVSYDWLRDKKNE